MCLFSICCPASAHFNHRRWRFVDDTGCNYAGTNPSYQPDTLHIGPTEKYPARERSLLRSALLMLFKTVATQSMKSVEWKHELTISKCCPQCWANTVGALGEGQIEIQLFVRRPHRRQNPNMPCPKLGKVLTLLGERQNTPEACWCICWLGTTYVLIIVVLFSVVSRYVAIAAIHPRWANGYKRFISLAKLSISV